MELTQLIKALSNPAAYPHEVPALLVQQTHISVVFLAGRFAYKIKKPVEMGFLDFRTLERRFHFCEEEVRLNRRLAARTYLGVVPVVKDRENVRVDGPGETIEWAVKMERLPEEANLEGRLQRQEITAELVNALAGRVAAFHVTAQRGRHIAEFGRLDVVARNVRENFEQAQTQAGVTVSAPVLARLCALTEIRLAELGALIERRAEHGWPCDTHGDLRLEHVYVFPERQPCADLVIIDCIEFSERFRYADPVADMAFLVMDFLFHGQRQPAEEFAAAYFEAAADADGQALLPFYTAYRAVVRGKVEGFELLEKEIPEAKRAAALTRARAHWLLALGELEVPQRRPCLVLLGGLPGTGKSTLAKWLAEEVNFHVIRSDFVRKELAGLSADKPEAAAFEAGIYSPEWTERTYQEMRRRAELLLFDGQRVLVDATFSREGLRRNFLDMATRLAVPGILIVCTADPKIVRKRLEQRAGDASDADWETYQRAAQQWEPLESSTGQALRMIDTGEATGAQTQMRRMLHEFRLMGDES